MSSTATKPKIRTRAALAACAAILAAGLAPTPASAAGLGGPWKRDTTPPSAPASLQADGATAQSVTFAWEPATDNTRVSGYLLYVGSSTTPAVVTSPGYTVAGLDCGTSVDVQVIAFDRAGNRSDPAAATGSTSACGETGPPGPEPSPIAGQGYGEVFHDDFNTLDRSVWDDHIWYDETPNPLWTNFQTVDSSGILHLQTKRSWLGDTGQPYPYNTITTQSSGLTFDQGYFEARMKWTGGDGAWPGFWLYSYRHATNPVWPDVNSFCAAAGLATTLCMAGELDAFEGQGSEPSSFYGTIHSNSCGCYGVDDDQNANNLDDAGVDLTQDFHTYGMLWTSSEVAWYLDGRLMHTAAVYDTTNQPMFLLLQMWSGGWTYDPDETTPDTIETQVDWVRVWQSSG